MMYSKIIVTCLCLVNNFLLEPVHECFFSTCRINLKYSTPHSLHLDNHAYSCQPPFFRSRYTPMAGSVYSILPSYSGTSNKVVDVYWPTFSYIYVVILFLTFYVVFLNHIIKLCKHLSKLDLPMLHEGSREERTQQNRLKI